MSYSLVSQDLLANADVERAKTHQWFFKTGKGEYGEGDQFIGVRMPQIRKIVRKYFKTISLDDTLKLLSSEIHEFRMCGVLILTEKAGRSDDKELARLVKIYLDNSKYVNNWDLVDASAHKIVGRYLADHNDKRGILDELADSKLLWEQRIAIISTFWLIKLDQFEDTLRISDKLLDHEHDLIHKAVGWMLREVGNRDRKVEEGFLKNRYKKMPRTMLRYAIEKFDEPTRKAYLNSSV